MNGEDQSNKMENKNSAPNGEECNISFWVINNTDTSFAVEHDNLSWGKWLYNPSDIPANTSKRLAFRSCGRHMSLSGTEGSVKYSSDKGKVTLTIKWEVHNSMSGYLITPLEGEEHGLYELTLEHYDPNSKDPNPVLTINRKK